MGFARILVLIAVVLVVGGLLATVLRVSDERDDLAGQLGAVERREFDEQALREEVGRLRRDLADLLEENDQLYVHIGLIEKTVARLAIRARWAPADCPQQIRELLLPLFTFLLLEIRGTGEDELLGRDMLIFGRLCLERPRVR